MSSTYIHKYKCIQCGLHFIVLSWSDTWGLDPPPHCPECGQREAFMHWLDESDRPIYEHVPGDASLVGFG